MGTKSAVVDFNNQITNLCFFWVNANDMHHPQIQAFAILETVLKVLVQNQVYQINVLSAIQKFLEWLIPKQS